MSASINLWVYRQDLEIRDLDSRFRYLEILGGQERMEELRHALSFGMGYPGCKLSFGKAGNARDI
jgi:hypothetical protein